MRIKTADSFYVMIWIAGDYAAAVQACREFCMKTPLCVTVTPTAYVYTGGMQDGICVRLFNYPRFQTSPEKLADKAGRLAEWLRLALCQESYSIECPNHITWVSNRPEDQGEKA